MTSEASEQSPQAGPRRVRRRLFRFSLRTLLIISTFCCLGLGLWSVYVQPFRDQARSVQWAIKHDGQVSMESADGPLWQAWLVKKMVGPDSFVYVNQANLAQVDRGEDLLGYLAGLRSARRLTLDRLELDDRAASALAGFNRLEYLSLRYTRVTDEGLAQLSGLESLAELRVTGAPVTDHGLQSLSGCAALREVYIRWTEVTPEGVAELQKVLPECKIYHHRLAGGPM